MEELFISVASGVLICATVGIPWLIFCYIMLTYGDANDFNKRKR